MTRFSRTKAFLGRFIGEDRGNATVEFALMLPPSLI